MKCWNERIRYASQHDLKMFDGDMEIMMKLDTKKRELSYYNDTMNDTDLSNLKFVNISKSDYRMAIAIHGDQHGEKSSIVELLDFKQME